MVKDNESSQASKSIVCVSHLSSCHAQYTPSKRMLSVLVWQPTSPDQYTYVIGVNSTNVIKQFELHVHVERPVAVSLSVCLLESHLEQA